jgi:predicted ATPase with chaperone activity
MEVPGLKYKKNPGKRHHPLRPVARARDRILKVTRTMVNLDGPESIEAPPPSETIQYRTLDRSHWA